MKEEEEDVLVVTEKAVRFPGGGHQSLLVMLQFRLGHVSGSFGRFSHLLHHPTCEESAQKKGKNIKESFLRCLYKQYRRVPIPLDSVGT